MSSSLLEVKPLELGKGTQREVRHKTHVAGLRAASTLRSLILKQPTRALQLPAPMLQVRIRKFILISTPKETQISGPESDGTAHAPAINPQAIVLSDEAVLVYVLAYSGCRGLLTSGRVERVGLSELKVYDEYGAVFEYVSGTRLRSWCVLGRDGHLIDGWSQIHPQDAERLGSHLPNRED